MEVDTSKPQKCCETSSVLDVDMVKNEAILREVLKKWKVECKADGLVPMRFLSKSEDLMLQNATL